jgi:hypothetical protein
MVDKKLADEIRDLREEGMGDLILFSYDRLADGGRARKINRRIDPDTESALRRLFDLPPVNGSDSGNTAKSSIVMRGRSKK